MKRNETSKAAAVLAEVQKDKLLYVIVIVYAVSTDVVAWYAGSLKHLIFPLYFLGYFLLFVGVVPGIAFVVWQCFASVVSRPKKPFQEFFERIQVFLTPRRIANYASVLLMAFFFGVFLTAKSLLSFLFDFSLDRKLADADLLVYGVDAWRATLPLVTAFRAHEWIQLVYGPVWIILIPIVTLVVLTSGHLNALRNQFILTWCLCWIILGTVVAGLFMSAGPAFYGEVTGDYARFQPLLNILLSSKGTWYGAIGIQSALWQTYTQKIVNGNAISAFPSLHVSITTLYVLLCLRIGRVISIVALAFLCIILIGSVYLGWHYAIDGIFAIIATFLIWKMVGLLYAVRFKSLFFRSTSMALERRVKL